jgi:two-component system cell cycle response regulator CpdR
MASILVVEDAKYLQKLISETLKLRGHEVVFAESGKGAYRLCQEDPFDLIITDIVMPDMDGIELIRSLRASRSQAPILAVSGAFEGTLKIALALGAAATLKKPFGPADLLAAVDKIFANGKFTP